MSNKTIIYNLFPQKLTNIFKLYYLTTKKPITGRIIKDQLSM